MGIRAKQFKQVLARLSDDTEITGIELKFVDDLKEPTTSTEASISFEMEGMELTDVSIKAESNASMAIHGKHHCCPCPPPPPPYFHY